MGEYRLGLLSFSDRTEWICLGTFCNIKGQNKTKGFVQAILDIYENRSLEAELYVAS